MYNDDVLWISNARFDMHLGNLLSFRVVGFFRPLINLSFYIQERVFPDNTPLYYYSNLVVHYGNSVLAYALLRNIFHDRRLAMCAAFLFLITSVHYSAIVWISARTTLISSFFVLLSLVVLLRWKRIGVALVSYMLALAAKETASAGFLAVGLLFWYGRRTPEIDVDRRAVVAFGLVTALYMAVRFLSIGHLVQGNWAPGPHMLTNMAGGFLYQVYPWYLAAITGQGQTIAASTHSLWPEILSLPIVLAALWGARRAGRAYQMGLFLAWIFLWLIPASPFHFRFFSTAMITQDRYYYLSSLGLCAALAMMLGMLWNARRWQPVLRVSAISVLCVMLAGESLRVGTRNNHWSQITTQSQNILAAAEGALRKHPQLTRCVVEEPMPSRPYVMHALKLKHPRWTVKPVLGESEAQSNRPCLYVRVESDGINVMVKSRVLE